MLLNSRVLRRFWQAASIPTPIVIQGGGRWGRVWAEVVHKAQGSGARVALVARSNLEDTRTWAAERYPNLAVVPGIEDAFAALPDAMLAIISTRPRDHVVDATRALGFGASVLIEKPISSDPESALRLVEMARAAGRVIGIGTEFAFLPAFHQAADVLLGCGEVVAARLLWHDPEAEVRYGETKVRHDEVSVLNDLAPHAISIFRVFANDPRFDVAAVRNGGSGQATLVLTNRRAGEWTLECNVRAPARKRQLDVRTTTCHVTVDFTLATPSISSATHGRIETRDGELTSTLRLELGAFIDHVRNGTATPVTESIPELIELQRQLLARGG